MGVTYKLTEEVIQYIIREKRENLALSCRALAERASQTFQTNISKSSVNDVLKSAQLSSSVGRRNAENNNLKKFIIPPEKKEIIRQDILGKSQNVSSSQQIAPQLINNKDIKPSPIKPKPIKLGASDDELKNIIKNIDGLSKAEPKKEVDNKAKQDLSREINKNALSKAASDSINQNAQPAEHKTIQKQDSIYSTFHTRERKGHLYNGMGFALLKAAEWEVSDKPFLGNLFKKYVKGPWEKNFEKSCEALIILKLLGIEKLDDTLQYRHHGLWRLSGFSDQPDLEKIYDWVKYLESPQNLIAEYMNESRQIFMEAGGIRFILEDGSKIYFDPSINHLMNSGEHSNSLAITKTLTLLSKLLVSAEHITWLKSVGNDQELYSVVWDMISAFENLPTKKIQTIEILSEAGGKMADFPVVVSKKRFFGFGISSKQKEFKELSKALRWAAKRQYLYPDQKQKIYITDTSTNWFSERLNMPAEQQHRLITFWQENIEEPFRMIVTNCFHKSEQEIIEEYLKKYPDIDKSLENPQIGNPSSVYKHQSVSEQAVFDSIWDIFKDFGLKLHYYAQRHFYSENLPKFSLNDYVSDIYSLPGYLIESEKTLNIILSLPPSFRFYEDLKMTIGKINQAQVQTAENKLIQIEVDY